jgi:hypothetical protein
MVPAWHAAAGGPCDHREHGARVRRDVRHLPRGRADAELPDVHGPEPGARRARPGVHERAGHVPHADSPDAEYSDTLELDLGTVEPSLAGPRRPQDRIRLSDVKPSFFQALSEMRPAPAQPPAPNLEVKRWEGEGGEVAPATRSAACHVEGAGRRAAGRRRGHRGHHELHEHVQPRRHGRRRLVAKKAAELGCSGSRGSRRAWLRARRSSRTT